jgi:putative solute:sodium symporter small subunit
MLLGAWFFCGFVMSIFFVEALNGISFGGVPFGFWMAQQGSIFVFVVLIFIFAILGDKLDRDAGVAEKDDDPSTASAIH